MERVSPAVIFLAACLLALALAGGVSASGLFQASEQPTVHTEENTTNYLSPAHGETTGTAYHEVSIDVSSAVAADGQELRATHDSAALEHRLSATDDPDRRNQLARQHLETIEQRYELLDERQETAFRAYEDGSLSATGLFRELASIRTAVAHQSDIREQAEQQADTDSDLLSRLHSREHALLVEQPVTDRIQRAHAGEAEPTTVYLQTGSDGLVLATVDDSTFLRETTLRSERNLAGEDQFVVEDGDGGEFQWGMPNAFHRTNDLYPWTFDRENLIQHDIGRADSSIHSQVYKITAYHVHGELSVYLDGGTRNVFHEAQQKPLTVQRRTDRVTNATESLSATVDLYGRAGPMQVTVTDDAGDPVADATVTVDGQTVGTTDEYGQLWTVRPHGLFDVGATTSDDREVTVSGPSPP